MPSHAVSLCASIGRGHLLVLDEAEEGGKREHCEEAVEDRGAAHDDGDAVGCQEKPSEEGEGGGAEQVSA